jgi:outer membrane protein assembly factor BamB
MIFIPAGFSKGTLLAIHPPTSGTREPPVVDATKATGTKQAEDSPSQLQVVWKSTRNVPNKPSLLVVDDLLFMVDDLGVASCVEAKTGTEVWRERVGGNYSAAPVYADGRIYFFNEEGKTTLIEAGRQFKMIAENKLEDGFMASPAIAGKALFLRTKTHLYRIEE